MDGFPLSSESLTQITSRGGKEKLMRKERGCGQPVAARDLSRVRFTSSRPPTPSNQTPPPSPPLRPSRLHYHNCVQNMRGRGSDHVILFTPCLAFFTNDMPLTARQTGARRHLLIRAVGAYQRRMAGNGYPVTNQISSRTESGPHLPGLH